MAALMLRGTGCDVGRSVLNVRLLAWKTVVETVQSAGTAV